jgi:hypothetical protein
MHIESTGMYTTRSSASAEVFALRGANCIGYIIQFDEVKKPAVWLVKDGTSLGGSVQEDLIQFVRRTPPRGQQPE